MSRFFGKRRKMIAIACALIISAWFYLLPYSSITYGCVDCLSITNAPTAAITLNDSDQTVSYILISNMNNTSNLLGWHLTITSTQLTNGTNNISKTASSITGVTAVCSIGQICTSMPQNTVTYPITLPADNPAPPAVSFFDARNATGIGTFDISAAINVIILANTYKGSYATTITVAFQSGP